MLVKSKVSLLILLGFLGWSLSAAAQEKDVESVTDEVKCKLILDDETDQMLCEAIFAAKRGAANAIEESLAADSKMSAVELSLTQKESWKSLSLFSELTHTEKLLPEAFVHASANLAFYEWVCQTGKFENQKSQTERRIRSLLSEISSGVLMDDYREYLSVIGYGNIIITRNRDTECDYDLFYVSKVRYLKSLEKIQDLVSRLR